jgi:nucleotide-binding universal stress UspA family protein
VLVPTDFGEPAAHALQVGPSLATAFGATLTVLHAGDMPTDAANHRAFHPEDVAATAARRALAGAVEAARRSGVRVDSILMRGAPRQRILDAVAERRIDLVIMGTHRRAGLSRALLGSVAERTVRTCPVPVLSVGAEDETVP